MNLFGKQSKNDLQNQFHKWINKIREENYKLNRQINNIKREEEKVIRLLKQAATKKNHETCAVLAKQIIDARRTVKRIIITKAQLNSMQLQMKNHLAAFRSSGSMQQSTEILRTILQLKQIPKLAKTIGEVSREMTKVGIIGEVVDESIDKIEEIEDIDEDTQEDIDRIILEITKKKIKTIQNVGVAQGTRSTDMNLAGIEGFIDDNNAEEFKGMTAVIQVSGFNL